MQDTISIYPSAAYANSGVRGDLEPQGRRVHRARCSMRRAGRRNSEDHVTVTRVASPKGSAAFTLGAIGVGERQRSDPDEHRGRVLLRWTLRQRARRGDVGVAATGGLDPAPPDAGPGSTVMAAPGPDEQSRWWQGGVFYQIYPRSYADSNGDGVGDLPGIISKLDHLQRLGVSGVWLSPVTCSPNRDWGYDVSDYRDIDPDYGTLDDLDTLVREAGATRHPHPHGPGAEPHERSTPVVRRRAQRPRRCAPRLLRVGRPQARRQPAQQLGEHLRRAGVGARRAQRAVLPAQLRGGTARPQLVERRCAPRVRGHRPVLVGPRRRRFPDRRLQHDDQGQGRCGTTRRRPRTTRSTSSSWACGTSTTPIGPRPTTS